MENKFYLVCGRCPWDRKVFQEVISGFDGDWEFISDSKKLTERLKKASLLNVNEEGELTGYQEDERVPDYVFFTHWSWKVPPEIVNSYHCINFHMTDLPYGRGGSPLQNLIERQKDETVVTAHRMTEELDTGDIYLKQKLSLHGNAEEIYLRLQYTIADMIQILLNIQETYGYLPSQPQHGRVTIFKRRTPEMSEIPTSLNLQGIYNHIRMLDAEGYPHAYMDWGDFRIEFTRANLYLDGVRASVIIKEKKGE